jgi:hypothetical protein
MLINTEKPNIDIFESIKRGDLAIVKQWLQIDPDLIRAKNSCGETPLHFAAEFNSDAEILQYLITQEADVNAKGNNGLKPLDVTNTEEKKQIFRNIRTVRSWWLNILIIIARIGGIIGMIISVIISMSICGMIGMRICGMIGALSGGFIFGIIGAGIGTLIGGYWGVLLGWAIGSMINRFIAKVLEKIDSFRK